MALIRPLLWVVVPAGTVAAVVVAVCNYYPQYLPEEREFATPQPTARAAVGTQPADPPVAWRIISDRIQPFVKYRFVEVMLDRQVVSGGELDASAEEIHHQSPEHFRVHITYWIDEWGGPELHAWAITAVSRQASHTITLTGLVPPEHRPVFRRIFYGPAPPLAELLWPSDPTPIPLGIPPITWTAPVSCARDAEAQYLFSIQGVLSVMMAGRGLFYDVLEVALEDPPTIVTDEFRTALALSLYLMGNSASTILHLDPPSDRAQQIERVMDSLARTTTAGTTKLGGLLDEAPIYATHERFELANEGMDHLGEMLPHLVRLKAAFDDFCE